jgi:hypothetical protein
VRALRRSSRSPSRAGASAENGVTALQIYDRLVGDANPVMWLLSDRAVAFR